MQSPRELAAKYRKAWHALTRWAAPEEGAELGVDVGRIPIRQAIRAPEALMEPTPTADLEQAREQLERVVRDWPQTRCRMAIEGDTGLGKTSQAVRRCAAYVVKPWTSGTLLFVAHSVSRVAEVVAMIREEIAARGGPPGMVADLLGRQQRDVAAGHGWDSTRFACLNPIEVAHTGKRGHSVMGEVCKECPLRTECSQRGYLRHTEDAYDARVVVTTLARLATLPDRLWESVSGVIADEDVTPGLLQTSWVYERSLRRAKAYIERRVKRSEQRLARPGGRMSSRAAALRAALPLVDGVLSVLRGPAPEEPSPLVGLLPEECEIFMTNEGLSTLRRALPVVVATGPDGLRNVQYTEQAPAEWEVRSKRTGRVPHQIWGPLLGSLLADFETGDTARAATVRVVKAPKRTAPSRLHIVRFDERTLRHLRARPLLLLDATLHPAIAPLLDVERVRVAYRESRRVVQAVMPLCAEAAIREGTRDSPRLSARGRMLVAQAAAWCAGRRAVVLCRKSVRPLLEAEARRYYELRRVQFVTPKRERGWDAAPGTRFIVIGRYARNGTSCEREAHALRSAYRRMVGSTQALDVLERPGEPQPFVGRGHPLLLAGEPAERVPKVVMSDRLAALIQDADRIATVRQFVGRDRQGTARVLLLRGDPTISADALVLQRDVAGALPATACRSGRKDDYARGHRAQEGEL